MGDWESLLPFQTLPPPVSSQALALVFLSLAHCCTVWGSVSISLSVHLHCVPHRPLLSVCVSAPSALAHLFSSDSTHLCLPSVLWSLPTSCLFPSLSLLLLHLFAQCTFRHLWHFLCPPPSPHSFTFPLSFLSLDSVRNILLVALLNSKQ